MAYTHVLLVHSSGHERHVFFPVQPTFQQFRDTLRSLEPDPAWEIWEVWDDDDTEAWPGR